MELPDPIPLPESGKYSLDQKPLWRLKPKFLSDFRLSSDNPYTFSKHPLKQSFPQPSTLAEMKPFLTSLISQPERSFDSSIDVDFDSYIESGNLEKVHQKSINEFDLILKCDTSSHRHSHWFMFKVHKSSPGLLKFNILNFMKAKSLLRKGMKPVAESLSRGTQEVANLKYFRTFNDSSKFYTVSFEFEHNQADGWVTYSLCRPYSFTRLINLLKDIENVNEVEKTAKVIGQKLVYRREVLCESLAGFPIYVITVSGEENRKKSGKGVIFTARVHPGETVSSYVMEGFLRFLLSPVPQAVALRSAFIFKIIPMLNPDGVICGNSRTSLVGYDLNRVWNQPDINLHPCIHYTKEFIKKFTQRYETLLYCDFHGHGKKLGSFIYGCNKIVNGSFTSWTKVRLFPRIVAKNTALFSYNNCIFSINPRKEGAGRVVIWKEIGISNSFTIETSFFGYHNGTQIIPFSTQNLFELGQDICKSLLEYTILIKNLEKELQLTNGWLKPNKFKEVSGTPALQMLSKKVETERKEQKNFEIRAKTSIRPNSKGARVKLKELISDIEIGPFPDWKSYFNSEEVSVAQMKIEVGVESPAESSSTESSGEFEESVEEDHIRDVSPAVEDLNFWVMNPRAMKSIKKEQEVGKCKFIKQHTSDFSGCYMDSIIVKNISTDAFVDNQRNMFFSRAERTRMHKERIAKTRSMSSRRDNKVIVEQDSKTINEKIFKIRPKVQKNYFFSKEKQQFKPPALCINSLRVNPLKNRQIN